MTIFVVLLLLLGLFIKQVGAIIVNKTEVHNILGQKRNIVAFYNLFAEGPYFDKIVKDQIRTIQNSGLLERLDQIFYVTIGKAGATYDIPGNKFTHLVHRDGSDEVITLHLLYEFCQSNPTSKVLYFHDKGSFHPTKHNNARFCATLNCFVLNPNCIEALDTHDTCGWRISPFPRIHYSGNFWWARCQYVNTLMDPMDRMTNKTFIAASKPYSGCLTIDRYFNEAWIGTGPTIYPADCMNSSIDTSYVFGYDVPPAVDAYCHGPDSPQRSGLPCQTASTFVNVTAFKNMKNLLTEFHYPACKDNHKVVVSITKMSELWYGQPPTTYLDWMHRLYGDDFNRTLG